MTAEKTCSRCDGCHFIATDDNESPWWQWETLPVGSAQAVILGLVQRIPCPQCNPDRKLTYVRVKELPLWTVT